MERPTPVEPKSSLLTKMGSVLGDGLRRIVSTDTPGGASDPSVAPPTPARVSAPSLPPDAPMSSAHPTAPSVEPPAPKAPAPSFRPAPVDPSAAPSQSHDGQSAALPDPGRDAAEPEKVDKNHADAQKSKVAKSPSSQQDSAAEGEPGWMKRTFLRFTAPNAKIANVGNKMEAYFDEDKKRWVFPGEEEEEDQGPPLAPPTTKDVQKARDASGGSQPPGTPAPAADPIASLMAPPPARSIRSVSSARSRYVDPFAAAGGAAAPPAAGQAGAAAPPPTVPKFAVFTPKPSSSS